MSIINDIKFNFKKNIFCFVILFTIFFLDRISKIKILNNFSNGNSFYINEYLNFDLIWNTGIGFGLLSYQSNFTYHLLTTFIALVVLTIIFFGLKSNTNEKYLYFIVAGGALGNIYDRAVYFAVPDFIDFHINNYHWFTFNIADIFISIGIILLIIYELFSKNEKKN